MDNKKDTGKILTLQIAECPVLEIRVCECVLMVRGDVFVWVCLLVVRGGVCVLVVRDGVCVCVFWWVYGWVSFGFIGF